MCFCNAVWIIFKNFIICNWKKNIYIISQNINVSRIRDRLWSNLRLTMHTKYSRPISHDLMFTRTSPLPKAAHHFWLNPSNLKNMESRMVSKDVPDIEVLRQTSILKKKTVFKLCNICFFVISYKRWIYTRKTRTVRWYLNTKSVNWVRLGQEADLLNNMLYGSLYCYKIVTIDASLSWMSRL